MYLYRLTFLCLVLILSGCQNNSPQKAFKQLQEQANACLAKSDNVSVACKASLSKLRLYIGLATELRKSPQGFGMKILGLQQKLVEVKNAVQSTQKPDELKKHKHEIAQIEQKLTNYLSVIAIFESPDA